MWPSGKERVGRLKSVPRRSWTGRASRAEGGTGKGRHEEMRRVCMKGKGG